jgi:hypothetical protein
METSTMQEEINKIKEKYSNVPEKELKEALKGALKGAWKQPSSSRKETVGEIYGKLKDIIVTYDKMPLLTFKKTLTEAWKAVHPNGIAKTTRKKSEWHIFMQEHGATVRQENPNMSQRECIKILGQRYKEAQQTAKPQEPVPVAAAAPVAKPPKRAAR